jgi:hypothetical protein
MAYATYNGMGLHVWQYTPELEESYYLHLGIASEFYVMSLMGYKVALLLLYLQLFNVVKRFRVACYITMFYTIGYLFCNLITQFLGCDPPQKTWQADLPGHCINTVAANIAYGAGHMSSDLIIALLPLPMVWRLQMRTMREKVGITIVLGSGFIAWAIACIRYAVSTYDMVSYDRTWLAGIGFTFSILEVNTGLICACVPTLKPLLRTAQRSASEYYGSRKGSFAWASKGSRKGSIGNKLSNSDPSNRSGSHGSKSEMKVPKKSMSIPLIETGSTTSTLHSHNPFEDPEAQAYVDSNQPPVISPTLLHNPAHYYNRPRHQPSSSLSPTSPSDRTYYPKPMSIQRPA